MKSSDSNNKPTIMIVRISPEVSGELEALSRDTKRSMTYLASEAIADFVRRNAWQIARIKGELSAARAGEAGTSHEQVEAWMDSWGTDGELPRPA